MESTAVIKDEAEILASYKRYWLIRANQGLTDKEIVKMSGVTPNCIVNWRNGRSVPREKALFKIANTLGVMVSDFFEGG